MKDLFGEDIKEAPEPEAKPQVNVIWKGRVPLEEKEQKPKDLTCLLRPRPYTCIRGSKTQVWILNT